MAKKTKVKKEKLTQAQLFEHRYAIADVNEATKKELIQVVRKAAKAANQRLVRLERAGHTKGMYKSAMANLEPMHRKRFKERPDKLTIAQLRREYAALRDFLSAQTSTVQGINEADTKRWLKAKENGYTGTLEEFIVDIQRAYADYDAKKDKDSDVRYKAVVTGTIDIMQAVVAENKAAAVKKPKGNELIEYLQRSRESKERKGK